MQSRVETWSMALIMQDDRWTTEALQPATARMRSAVSLSSDIKVSSQANKLTFLVCTLLDQTVEEGRSFTPSLSNRLSTRVRNGSLIPGASLRPASETPFEELSRKACLTFYILF